MTKGTWRKSHLMKVMKYNYEVYDRITGFLYVRFIQKLFLKRTHMRERTQASQPFWDDLLDIHMHCVSFGHTFWST